MLSDSEASYSTCYRKPANFKVSRYHRMTDLKPIVIARNSQAESGGVTKQSRRH
jgi:hypothetical protein